MKYLQGTIDIAYPSTDHGVGKDVEAAGEEFSSPWILAVFSPSNHHRKMLGTLYKNSQVFQIKLAIRICEGNQRHLAGQKTCPQGIAISLIDGEINQANSWILGSQCANNRRRGI